IYLAWLTMINLIVLSEVDESVYDWEKLPTLYQTGYFDLISGRYLIKDISGLMKGLVTNWLNVSYKTDQLVSSTAILAWDEMFPNTLDGVLFTEAVSMFAYLVSYPSVRKAGFE